MLALMAMWELAPIQLVTSERFEGAQRRTMARWKATGVNITEKNVFN